MPVHAPQITSFDHSGQALAVAVNGELHAGDVVFVPSEGVIGLVRDNNLVYALTANEGTHFYVLNDKSISEHYIDSLEIADQLARNNGLRLAPRFERTIADFN